MDYQLVIGSNQTSISIFGKRIFLYGNNLHTFTCISDQIFLMEISNRFYYRDKAYKHLSLSDKIFVDHCIFLITDSPFSNRISNALSTDSGYNFRYMCRTQPDKPTILDHLILTIITPCIEQRIFTFKIGTSLIRVKPIGLSSYEIYCYGGVAGRLIKFTSPGEKEQDKWHFFQYSSVDDNSLLAEQLGAMIDSHNPELHLTGIFDVTKEVFNAPSSKNISITIRKSL